MRNFKEFVNESLFEDNVLFENALEINEDEDLQMVYEQLFYMMFMVNEGIFSKIGNALKKGLNNVADKAGKAGESIDAKIEKMSDAAKKAIELAKKEAGDAWDSVKDTYVSAVSAVDTTIAKSKGAIQDMAKRMNAKVENIEAAFGKVYSTAIATGSQIGKAIAQWFLEPEKNDAQISAMNTFLSALMVTKSAGIKQEQLVMMIKAAGIE